MSGYPRFLNLQMSEVSYIFIVARRDLTFFFGQGLYVPRRRNMGWGHHCRFSKTFHACFLDWLSNNSKKAREHKIMINNACIFPGVVPFPPINLYNALALFGKRMLHVFYKRLMPAYVPIVSIIVRSVLPCPIKRSPSWISWLSSTSINSTRECPMNHGLTACRIDILVLKNMYRLWTKPYIVAGSFDWLLSSLVQHHKLLVVVDKTKVLMRHFDVPPRSNQYDPNVVQTIGS